MGKKSIRPVDFLAGKKRPSGRQPRGKPGVCGIFRPLPYREKSWECRSL